MRFFSYKNFKQKIITINWERSWNDEVSILNKLSKERSLFSDDPIYDSLFQFKAQTYFLHKWEKIILWIISLIGFLFLLCKYLLNNLFNSNDIKFDIAYFFSEKIFSEDLKENRRLIFIPRNRGTLSGKDLRFLFSVLRKLNYNFSIVSVATFRIGQIHYAKRKHDISAIWSNMEYTASCGIVKKYCNKNKIQFVNFMHGEKVLTLRDAFCSFDLFYVWDEHYLQLFKTLNCRSRIEISNPWIKKNNSNIQTNMSVCYFLKGLETESEIVIIKNSFFALEKLGYKISIKPHPRQRNNSDRFTNFKIVDSTLDIIEILSEFEFIMAQFSTVLVQSWYLNHKVILDNLSNKELFESLNERKYFFSEQRKGVLILSDLIREFESY